MKGIDINLGVIGAGNMAEALIGGALRAGVLEAGRVTAADPAPERREIFARLGTSTTASNRAAVSSADMVILAVKPQVCPDVLEEIAPEAPGRLFVSIMAGISIEKIGQHLGDETRIIRTMPNTPLLAGMGATVLAAGKGASAGDMKNARALFECSGLALQMHESELDAVTAVSGSGPAYLFYLAEAMIRAAREENLTESASRDLVVQTLRGAAELLERTGQAPEELRRRVTSPGGTTQAAIELLDAGGVDDMLVKAIHRAAERSRELGQQ